MSDYVGDFGLGDTFDVKFTTVNTSGVPTVLAGSPVISAYVGNNVTQLTAGITLSVDFDGVVGLNNLRVVATSGNGYATASNYQLVITTGTVGGASVVGYVIGQFSIEARSALRPTVAARTLDVSATGEAGLDWANVGSPTTAQNLSATNIDVDQVVASVSGSVGSVTGSVGSVTGLTVSNLDATVSSRSTYAGGAVASVAAAVTVGTNNDKTGYALSGAGIQAIWDALTSALTTVGSIGKWIVDKLDAAVTTRMATFAYTAPLDAAGTRAAVGLASANLDTQLSSKASQTSVDDLPTNAELATALGTADDATLAAIAALNNLSSAQAQTAAASALTAYDPPTQAEMDAGLGAIELAPAEHTAIANEILDLAAGVETGLTLRQAMRLLAAANAGKLSGAGTTTIVIRNAVADSKDRITATVDASKNRTAIVYDLT